MPLFEYQCAECGHKFEELVPNSETKVSCPRCKSAETRKLLSVFSSSMGSSGSAAPSCGARGCGSGFS